MVTVNGRSFGNISSAERSKGPSFICFLHVYSICVNTTTIVMRLLFLSERLLRGFAPKSID